MEILRIQLRPDLLQAHMTVIIVVYLLHVQFYLRVLDGMMSEVVLRKLAIADNAMTVVDHALRCLERWSSVVLFIRVVDL